MRGQRGRETGGAERQGEQIERAEGAQRERDNFLFALGVADTEWMVVLCLWETGHRGVGGAGAGLSWGHGTSLLLEKLSFFFCVDGDRHLFHLGALFLTFLC